MAAERQEETILVFTGKAEQKGPYTIITCNEAPIVGWAESPSGASADTRISFMLYRDALRKRGELQDALSDGTIPYVRVLDTPESHERTSRSISDPNADYTWLIPLSEHI